MYLSLPRRWRIDSFNVNNKTISGTLRVNSPHLVVNGSLTSPAVTVQAGGLLREPLQFRPYPDRFGLAFLNDSIKNSKTQEGQEWRGADSARDVGSS